MTVDGVARPRTATQRARADAGPAVPLPCRAVPSLGAVATVAPPWQRVPDAASEATRARPRRTVTLVPGDGWGTGTVRPTPTPIATAPPPAPAAPTVHRPPVLRARPPVVEDPGILGLSRLTRGRVGSRLFTLFFVGVFALIAVQTLVELLHG